MEESRPGFWVQLRFIAALCFATLPWPTSTAVTCKIETDVVYAGADLAITIPGSSIQGCSPQANAQACCALCSSYWPQCLSWQYIKNGNGDNGLQAKNGYCCLKGSLRPSAATDNCCDSGYQNPQCMLTETCNFEIDGVGLSATDSLVVVPSGEECGYNQSESWTGIVNPKSVTAVAPYKTYDFGQATGGNSGDFRLCYRSSAGDVEDYTQLVGLFTMRGPSPNQAIVCTLGAQCWVTLAGTGFKADPAQYKILIVDGSCPELGGTLTASVASFSGMANPDNVEDDNADNVYKTGAPLTGDTTKTYTICWANNPASNDDYTLPIGTFRVGGPFLSHAVCTMGADCIVVVPGSEFSSTNAILIGFATAGALCGQTWGNTQTAVSGRAYFDQTGTSFSNPQTVTAQTSYATSETFNFGIAIMAHLYNMPGAYYRMCWTQAVTLIPSQPENFYNYGIDAGSFTLVGPQLANQGCSFTANCALTLTGYGINVASVLSSWGILIAAPGSSCGSSDIVAADLAPNITESPSSGFVNPAASSGSYDVTFGTASIGAASLSGVSNVYVACWGPRPSQLSHYTVTLGEFIMGGPQVMNVECTKGLACDIVITGSRLANTNKMLFVGSGECGNAVAAVFAPMTVEKTPNDDGIYTQYQFGMANTGTARTSYVMCWGYNPTTQNDISFNMGLLTMNGANAIDRTCTLGLSCIITLQGQGLAATNRILVITSGSCGDNGPGFAFFTGWVYEKQVENVVAYTAYSMGTPTAGLPGTSYKICWAHDAVGAAIGNLAYRVSAGLLTMVGPYQIAQVCTMSLACNLQLTGTNLAITNKVMIVSGTVCGSATPTLGTFSGLTNPTQAEPSDASAYSLGIPSEGTPGNAYSVCWAHDPATNADYQVRLGTFSVNGPYVLALAECTLGITCVVTISGYGLAATNKIMVTAFADTCGSTNLNEASIVGLTNPGTIGGTLQNFPLGTPTDGVVGDYTICWGHHPTIETDYWVRKATLRISGPYQGETQCTLSVDCRISLTGVNLAHTSKVLIIQRTSTCGEVTPVLGSWTGVFNPGGTALLAAPANPGYTLADSDTYTLGHGIAGIPGFEYTLCWAFDPAGALGNSEYKVPVGIFSMNGPRQGTSLACTLGQPCNVQLIGWRLANTNRMQIIAGTGACGSGTVEQATLEGITNPQLVIDDPYDNSYAMGAVIVGGSYSACRVASPASTCIGDHYRLCWSHGSSDSGAAAIYSVYIGTFSMSGPYTTYATECLLGAVCAFRLYGSNFASTNRIMIIEKTSTCGDAAPQLASLTGLSNPQKAAEVNADGTDATYRLGRSLGGGIDSFKLCWGFNPVVPFHYNIEVGTFYFKDVPAHCVISDGLTLTCDAVSS